MVNPNDEEGHYNKLKNIGEFVVSTLLMIIVAPIYGFLLIVLFITCRFKAKMMWIMTHILGWMEC